MKELELLDAEVLGQEAAPGSSWWKWALGLAAAGCVGYVLVKDLNPQDLVPRHVPFGRRPW